MGHPVYSNNFMKVQLLISVPNSVYGFKLTVLFESSPMLQQRNWKVFFFVAVKIYIVSFTDFSRIQGDLCLNKSEPSCLSYNCHNQRRPNDGRLWLCRSRNSRNRIRLFPGTSPDLQQRKRRNGHTD